MIIMHFNYIQFSHQNSSDALGHGLHKPSEQVLWWLLGTKTSTADPLSTASSKVRSPWTGFVSPVHSTDTQLDRDLGNLVAKAKPRTLYHVPETTPEQKFC